MTWLLYCRGCNRLRVPRPDSDNFCSECIRKMESGWPDTRDGGNG